MENVDMIWIYYRKKHEQMSAINIKIIIGILHRHNCFIIMHYIQQGLGATQDAQGGHGDSLVTSSKLVLYPPP